MNNIQIPIPCPKCDGKMIATKYESSLRILKERSWQVCKDCNFQRNIENFKKSLLTV